MRPLILASILLFSNIAFGERIRTIHMNQDSMKDIYLKMGQSTVIRFLEKPVKVVIGNQNFYSVEFIENDVTIQPLGVVKTNLFVYTPHHVYGFILKPNHNGSYDDIVNVKWSSSGFVLKKTPRKKLFSEKKLNQVIKLKSIEVSLKKIIINKHRGTHIIEFQVLNNGLKKLKSKDLKFYLTRSNKKLPVQEAALIDPVLRPFKAIDGRLLVKLDKKQGFTFNVEHQMSKKGVIVSRWSL